MPPAAGKFLEVSTALLCLVLLLYVSSSSSQQNQALVARSQAVKAESRSFKKLDFPCCIRA
jgi:hypothetical protein